MTDEKKQVSEDNVLACGSVKYGLLALGFGCVGLGVLGMFLPVLPTTIFFIIALWAFSKSSVRAHQWLYNHPRFGAQLRDWHQHKMIPLKAKVLAVTMITGSFLYITVYLANGWLVPILTGVILGSVIIYIVTRPHRISDTV